MNIPILKCLKPFVVYPKGHKSLPNHERYYLINFKPIFSLKINLGFGKLSPNGVFLTLPLLIGIVSNSYAVDVYQLPDPAQQKAYESLTSELRCLVCQNQNIADSNAELAADLRRQVYEMLQQGKTKEEIITFMTDRYGDFVLYNPPFKAKTGLLWLGPVLFLLLGLIMVFWLINRRKKLKVNDISLEQHALIRHLLEDEDQP